MQSSNKTPKTPKKMTIILGDNATLYGNHGNNLANKPTSHWVRQVLNLLTIPHPTARCTYHAHLPLVIRDCIWKMSFNQLGSCKL